MKEAQRQLIDALEFLVNEACPALLDAYHVVIAAEENDEARRQLSAARTAVAEIHGSIRAATSTVRVGIDDLNEAEDSLEKQQRAVAATLRATAPIDSRLAARGNLFNPTR